MPKEVLKEMKPKNSKREIKDNNFRNNKATKVNKEAKVNLKRTSNKEDIKISIMEVIEEDLEEDVGIIEEVSIKVEIVGVIEEALEEEEEVEIEETEEVSEVEEEEIEEALIREAVEEIEVVVDLGEEEEIVTECLKID
jgi:hypothetical protein